MHTEFAQRLRQAIKGSGLTQAKVADRLGIKPQSVNQWLMGKSFPKRDILPKLSHLLGTSVTWLLEGKGEFPSYYENSLTPVDSDLGREVPLLPLEDIILPDNGRSSSSSGAHVVIKTHFRCGPRARAFTMRDRSMEPRVNPGDIVVIDPDALLEPGDLVAAHIRDIDVIVFRQFSFADGDRRKLTPINLHHRGYEFSAEDWEAQVDIVGVMTERTEQGKK